MSRRLQIDHVGVLGPGIDELVEEFQRLGFSVVGPTELTSVDPDGMHRGLGQHSAHVMFDTDYIELTAVEKPFPGHHLEHFLQRPWGLRLLLPACDDIDAAYEECAANGMRPSPVQDAARTLDYNPGKEAHFRWFGLPADDWPEVLLAFVEHRTPSLVFDPDITRHDNGAIGLQCLYFVGNELPERLALLATGGKHEIVIVPPDSARDMLGFDVSHTTPFAGVGISVRDLALTKDLLEHEGIETHTTGESCAVQTMTGVCIVFVQVAG